ncbi:hypothetical protein E4T66_18180 [Sinimarinibacterium sp. CAU 1509]|uniref:hypothetical protein n=1 Tax=Sinimarinibacterium sp. CAU 1509 TaxID=2562283 RepID=UPI0010ABA73F|nr:hypothetical protein [Sinimarinibacterium sp. CAU 1509]TJY57334.1 hypothetical protein E4T66_18180 [Sinimarinibacterium sp. CAU 1509]
MFPINFGIASVGLNHMASARRLRARLAVGAWLEDEVDLDPPPLDPRIPDFDSWPAVKAAWLAAGLFLQLMGAVAILGITGISPCALMFWGWLLPVAGLSAIVGGVLALLLNELLIMRWRRRVAAVETEVLMREAQDGRRPMATRRQLYLLYRKRAGLGPPLWG